MVPFTPDTAPGVFSLQWDPSAFSMPSTRPTVCAKLLIGANLMKFHQIQRIDVSTGRKHPDGAQARRVAAPYIASTAPAVSPSADTHRWLSSIESSLGAHAVTAHPHRWICGRTALQSSRRRRLLGVSATLRHHTTAAESKKPCQSRVCGSAEPWQQARQGHLSTARRNRSATAVNMHAVIAGVRRRGSSPHGRWEHMFSSMDRRQPLCRTVCKKRLRGQLDPSAGSPGRSRRHSQRCFSHLPSHPVSDP